MRMLILCIYFFAAMAVMAQNQIPDAERQALMDLYEATNGDQWRRNSGWKDEHGQFTAPGTEGDWYGVNLSEEGDAVLGISLSHNHLKGKIPDSFSNLTQLGWLRLSSTELSEFPLPVTELPNLTSLSLGGAGLTGTIPKALGNLKQLKYLFLGQNELEGAVPASMNQLRNLSSLYLQGNALTSLPDLSGMTSLVILQVQDNLLTGPIPTWIANMAQLRDLYLSENQLTGGVPAELATLESLSTLDLSANQIDHFPRADWRRGLKILLHDNRLTQADCEALNTAFNGGTRVAFYGQKTGRLPCDVNALRQSLPWVSKVTGEWNSSIVVFNPSSQQAFVQVSYPEQETMPLIEVRARSYEEIALPDLGRGYHVQVYSDNPQVMASYFVSGQLSPSGNSPAMTLGQNKADAASHVMFPVLPGSLKAAFAIHAAEAVGQTNLTLRLHGTAGLLGMADLQLQDDQPTALLLPNVFPNVATNADLALEVIGPAETKLLGTAFAFNDSNEPAMMPAVPFDQARSDWMFPWAASNALFVSRLSIFNPGAHDAETEIQAITPQGETREVSRVIPAGSHGSFETAELFPQFETGYALRLKTVRGGTTIQQKVFANIQVGSRQDRPSGSSPALTHALDPTKLTSTVALPFPTLEGTPAMVLQAPDQTEPSEVLLMYHSHYGREILGSVILEGGQPKPVLMKDFFSSHARNPILVFAMATSGEPIAGTIFSFNEFREPSMTQGLDMSLFDLDVSLNYQADETAPLVAIVENNGPFTSLPGAAVAIFADRQEIHRRLLEPLAVGERVVIQVPAESQLFENPHVELEARLVTPSSVLDIDHVNDRITLPSIRTLEVAHSHRLSQSTDEFTYTGLLHADEDAFEVFFSKLVMMPGDELQWELERLEMGTTGNGYKDPTYRFTYDWQPADQAKVVWDSEKRTFQVSSLQTSAVYRLSLAIRTAAGETLESGHKIGLSKSTFDKVSMDVFERPANLRAAPRVYHLFDNRNWLEDYFNIRFRNTGFSGDEVSESLSLSTLVSELRKQAVTDLVSDYVLEMPEGVVSVNSLNIVVHPWNRTTPMNFKLLGAGKQKTFIADLHTEPTDAIQRHGSAFRERILISRIQDLELKGFALWGATPGDSPTMEVSGRPTFSFRGQLRRPYAWFAAGVKLNHIGKLAMSDVDLRFHSVGLLMDDAQRAAWPFDPQTRLSDVDIAYCDLALVMDHKDEVNIASVGIHHASSQGILGNHVSNIVIEKTQIDGARHRGINLDRARQIQIRNNRILNSGQSAIHLGGNVHFVAMIGNTIETVDRDRVNPFGDQNSVEGTIMSYRPLYEGIKSARGVWGTSTHLLIADNDIRDVANGIAIAQVNQREVVIENNTIEAMQRGIRLEFGRSQLLIENGYSFDGELRNLFVMPDNQISMVEPVATDNQLRHGILFPENQPDCLGCNIDFMESYGEDLGKAIAYYPFPIEFTDDLPCEDAPNQTCRTWLSNDDFVNLGPVYLPSLGPNDYQHPNATSLPMDDAARTFADELRQKILDMLP